MTKTPKGSKKFKWFKDLPLDIYVVYGKNAHGLIAECPTKETAKWLAKTLNSCVCKVEVREI